MAKAARARVAGREAVAARTVWQLAVRGLRLRCVQVGAAYQVQARETTGWRVVASVDHPLPALRLAASSEIVAKVVRAWLAGEEKC
jgi:hypothetical protein